jgi:hypothetical protein
MSSIKVDVSALSVGLTESKEDYEKIFGTYMASGFDAKMDMTVQPVLDKIGLVREEIGNVTQPGRKNAINNPDHAVLSFKERIPSLKPAKVDILLDEIQLRQLAVSFIAKREPADPRDIHSIAGRQFLMSRIMKAIGAEVNRAIVRGQLGFNYDSGNSQSMFQGGLNLFDGLGVKFLSGFATTGVGAVGDIPASNKLPNAAASVTQANVLDELKKFATMIYETDHLYFQQEADGEASLLINPLYYQFMVNALDALTYKNDQVVQLVNGEYQFKLLPNTKIKKRSYMMGVDNMFWSPKDNLFYLHQDTETDVPKIKVQEVGRGVQILIDWEQDVDYADGRYIGLYK